MKLHPDSPKGFTIHIVAILLMVAVGLLFFFYVYLPSMTNHGETITVPDLNKLHMDKIDDFVTKRNLRYEVSDSTYSEDYPPLTIVEQYPKPGAKVKEGRKIFISVNRVNPPTVPVPDLVERSLRNAEAVLKSNELKRGRIIYQPSQFFDLVLEMKYNDRPISHGEPVPKGSTIDLVAGDGYASRNFKAPDLVGLELEEALFYIRGVRLEVGEITADTDTTGREVFVIDQDPNSGRRVSIGDIMNLRVTIESDSLYQRIKEGGD